jgi:hypothetical protein
VCDTPLHFPLRRNVIAVKVENFIDALLRLAFNSDSFLRPLDRFYWAIAHAVHGLGDHIEKHYFTSPHATRKACCRTHVQLVHFNSIWHRTESPAEMKLPGASECKDEIGALVNGLCSMTICSAQRPTVRPHS